MKKIYLSFLILVCFLNTKAQVVLNANGPGNTYELINSVLAPGHQAVEAPDVSHGAFGRHIAEVFDATLNKDVFEFYSHLSNDNDPSTSATDRQRVEIKTYDPSPANLLGVTGETVTYKWRFKIAAGFQPSDNFTHLHQIKAVGGDDSDPIFTLTARKGFSGGPNKMQLIYVENSALSSTTLQQVDLSLFEDTWVEATEKIEYGAMGKYSLVIKKLSDNSTIMSFAKMGFITIRGDNTFARPKWGIYRSIATPTDLRDEAVRFSDFSIAEGATSFTQTYYWIGGTGGIGIMGFNLSDPLKWNTILNGSGVLRSDVSLTALTDDILIFDGSNIGGNMPATGQVTVNVTGQTVGQLIFQNNANVLMKRAGGTTGTIVVNGDGTALPDFIINTGSTLAINNDLADGNININFPMPATGSVSGTITVLGTGTHRITSQTLNGLVFNSGATFNSGGLPGSAAYPFGSSTQGVQNGVQFLAGSNLVITGNRSPFGGTSTFQSCNMMPGSNTYFKATNAASTGSWVNLKTLGNLFIQNNATLTSDGPLYKVDTLTIDAGSTFIAHGSGNTPVLGNLNINGTYTTPAGTNALVLGGSVPQTVSGAGNMTVVNLVVANYSDVTLSRSIPVSSSTNIYGKINFGSTSQITGTGTFSTKAYTAPVTFTGNTTAGSFQITGVTAPTGITGLSVSGSGLSGNINTVGFSGTNTTINMSNPASSTTTGTVFTFTSDSATLVTSNSNGFGSMGSILSSGGSTFANGTNITLNAATLNPFPIPTTPSTYYLTFGNVIFNAPVTTNFNSRVRGSLTLNAGISTIRAADTLRLTSGLPILGSPFNTTKYLAQDTTTTTTGVLRIDAFSTPTIFPIGSATKYLPVTLSPSSAMSFSASVFEGLTTNGAKNEDKVTAAFKTNFVDAVWTVNRNGGTGSCDMELQWVPSLEGSLFSGLANTAIGITKNTGTNWQAAIGSGDNTTNIANATFTGFSPFTVGQLGTILALNNNSLKANKLVNGANLIWHAANVSAISNFEIEKSLNGINFLPLTTILPSVLNTYNFADLFIWDNQKVYYRIKFIATNGTISFSNTIMLKNNAENQVVVFPNPTTDFLNFNGLINTGTIKIYDAIGKLIINKNYTTNALSINCKFLNKGVYFITIQNNETKKTTKFIKN